MGKKIKDSVLQNKPKYQDSPVNSSLFFNDPVGRGNTDVLESKYDINVSPSNLENLNTNRAKNQPWYDQIANSAGRLPFAIALDLVETTGDIAELLDQDDDKEYQNALTVFAQKGKDKLGDFMTNYQEGASNKLPSAGDSGWWINMGEGLITSIASFAIAGAGIGGTLGKGAKVLNFAIKGGETGLKLGSGLAQLGTAAGLTHAEAVRSGAQIYDQIKKEVLQNGYDYIGDGIKVPVSNEEAIRIASIGASTTYKDSFYSNLALNVTSLSPIFKSYGKLDDGIKNSLKHVPGEDLGKYVNRIETVMNQQPKKAFGLRKLLGESGQEYLEETNTLVAEKLGIAAVDKNEKRSALDIYSDTFTSEEGFITGVQGALGGLGQTAGLEYTPYKTFEDEQGKTRRVSNAFLQGEEKLKYQKQTLLDFTKDLKAIKINQAALEQAVIGKDKEAIELARNNLFNVGVLRSLRTETVEDLASTIQSIASVNNTTINANGSTDAIDQGLADNIDDNRYKETAIKKAADVKQLNREYRDLLAHTEKPFVATELFRERLGVYSYESTLE